MINHYSKASSGNVLSKEYQQIKEHLFARVLVDRAEELQHLSQGEMIAGIKANYGAAAWDILEQIMKGADWQRFTGSNELQNFFDLSAYARTSFTDRKARRGVISDLIFDYAFSLVAENTKHPGLELLIYGCDAIAFLAKNKIQFIEDFNALFSGAEGVNPEAEEARYEVGNRIMREKRLSEAFRPAGNSKGLNVRQFSTSLQEAAYCDLTSGSFKAPISGLQQRSFLGGNVINYGEKAYWDPFFWLRPGAWLRQNLANIDVLL